MTPESHPWSNRHVAEHVVHWDEVEPFRADEGAFQSTWTDLGRAAGSVTVGVKRVQVDPGARSTPRSIPANLGLAMFKAFEQRSRGSTRFSGF